ncbi:MAG: DUF58 domain-containing protein [Alphaproteobacteria bacterium]|nr:DUF58 domain-containing protein [Alphaproteobacteria bacterium]
MVQELNDAVYASLESLVADKYQTYRLSSPKGEKSKKKDLGNVRSAFKGRGLDFDEVREYQPGDDVRLVDWRLTAKIGKVFTKVFREERGQQIWFLIDLRSGMKFGTKQAFKSVIAAHVMSMLAWYFVDRGDKVGGLVLSDNQMQVFRPSKLRKKIMAFYGLVSESTKKEQHFDKMEEEISLTQASLKLRRSCRNGNIIFVISDFSDLKEDTLKSFASLARTNELTFINVYDVLEGRCPTPNLYAISDGKSDSVLDTRSKDIHDAYIYYFQKRLMMLEDFVTKYHIKYIPVCSDSDYYDVVAKSLFQKGKKGR